MLLLFAPGAGLPSSSPWMTGWAERLGVLGHVVRFDYPYASAGRRRPDPLPRLIEAHQAALAEARERHPGPTVLIGKSMGSRVGCHVATEVPVDALVCLGYPLVGASRRKPVRDAVLLALHTPILFVQGTRDPLCPLDHLDRVRQRMVAPSEIIVVDGGDHSLIRRKSDLKAIAKTQSEADRGLVERIGAWLARVVGSRATPGAGDGSPPAGIL